MPDAIAAGAGEATFRSGTSRLGRLAGGLFKQSRALSSDYLLLAVLDARSAAVRFAWMLGAGVIVAILVVTAWLALIAGGIVWMVGAGASWPAALAVAAGLNLVAATVLGLWMRGLFRELPFAATLRQLRGEEAPAGQEQPA